MPRGVLYRGACREGSCLVRALLTRLVVASLLILGVGFTFASVQPAYAEDPLDKICITNPDSATCKSRGTGTENPLTGKDGLLYKISTIVAGVAGVVAVIMILFSGFQMITSSGDAQKAAGAKRNLTGAIIGLIIIALAQTVILFVVGRL